MRDACPPLAIIMCASFFMRDTRVRRGRKRGNGRGSYGYAYDTRVGVVRHASRVGGKGGVPDEA